MRLKDRNKLIARGILRAGGELYPSEIRFAGFSDPIPARRRGSLAGAAIRAGGFTGDVPVVFIVDKAELPAGLDIEPQKTCFLEGTTEFRVEHVGGEPSEPHVSLTCNLARR